MVVEEAVLSSLEWVERFAGWGVVVWVVWWFMREIRADRKAHVEEVDKITTSWRSVIDSFEAFQVEEREVHNRIIERLDRLAG